jgi:hypothetical protein
MCALDAHGTSPSTPIGALQTSAPVEGPKTDHASGPHRRRLLRSGESKAFCDAGSSSFLQSHAMHEVPALVTALLARMLLHSVCSHVPREVRGVRAQIHILMFLVAVVHICNSVVCLVVAQKRCLHVSPGVLRGPAMPGPSHVIQPRSHARRQCPVGSPLHIRLEGCAVDEMGVLGR